MANYEFHSYSADALVYNPSAGAFVLDPSYNPQTDRNLIKVTDNDRYFDGDARRDEVGDDRNQTGQVLDGAGNELASGRIYVEQFAWIEAPDGSRIMIDRVEIAGQNVGYVSSEPLTPGVSYDFIRAYEVDDNIQGSDTRETYDYYEANSVSDDGGAPCFGPGTMIMTEQGEIPVEWLDSSDKVLTRDQGFQPILWIGRTKVAPAYFVNNPDQRPVRIPAGALGPDSPTHDLHLTGDHRVLIRSAKAELQFLSSEVLAPAKAWVDAGWATWVTPVTDYVVTHILCAPHQVIVAQGAWVESMFTGKEAVRRLHPRTVLHLKDLLGGDLLGTQTARPNVTRKEALTLLGKPSTLRAPTFRKSA